MENKMKEYIFNYTFMGTTIEETAKADGDIIDLINNLVEATGDAVQINFIKEVISKEDAIVRIEIASVALSSETNVKNTVMMVMDTITANFYFPEIVFGELFEIIRNVKQNL